jgi:hypothetical protein
VPEIGMVSGAIQPMSWIVKRNIATVRMPGPNPAMNSRPMSCSVMMP